LEKKKKKKKEDTFFEHVRTERGSDSEEERRREERKVAGEARPAKVARPNGDRLGQETFETTKRSLVKSRIRSPHHGGKNMQRRLAITEKKGKEL